MRIKFLVLIAVFVFLYSCATAPKARVIQNSFPIDASYDTVWSALIETFAEMQFPIDNMEKDSGLIVTDWINIRGEGNEGCCDCGGLGVNTEVSREAKFNVFVKKVSENSCEVKVNCQFQQGYRFGDGPIYVRECVSTGNLEGRIFDSVETKTSM